MRDRLSELRNPPDDFLRALGKAPIMKESDINGFINAGLRLDSDMELSEPEKSALRCLSRGLTASEAGVVLAKSQGTVMSQLQKARYKLRVKNTTQACCEAIRLGLIP